MNTHQKEETPPSSVDHFDVLLVEDDPDDQDLIMDAFTETKVSFNLHIVENGLRALDYLNGLSGNELPSLIILDYNMPEMTGVQVLQKLCEETRYKAIPKIILSTSNNSKYIQEAEEKGAYAYRVKPLNFSTLVTIVKEMLEIARLPDRTGS